MPDGIPPTPVEVRDMLDAAEADLDQRQSAGQRAIRAWSYAAPPVRASVTAVLPLLGAALDDLAGFGHRTGAGS